ncbi:GMC oxidoreductase-domain-containing protein, partial [Mycena sanguinolenta]
QWTAPADDDDTQGRYNPAVHGTDGPIQVSNSGFSWSEFEHHVIQTTNELPNDFPFNLDMNSGKPLGIGKDSSWFQDTIGDGERTVLQRPNLDVLLCAQVSKLVNSTQSRIVPAEPLAFQGVEFKYGSSLYVAKASKEIIHSAGPIGTPQIFTGISTVLDLPSIGKNASEHPYFGLSWAVNSNQTVESITQNVTRYNEAFAQWNRSHTGTLVDSAAGTHAGWLRLSENSSVFDIHPDPSPGPDAPHFEVLFPPSEYTTLPGHFVSLTMAMVSPEAVTLSTADPFAAPLVDLGLFSDEFDPLALTEGIQLALKFVTAPTWNAYLGGGLSHLVDPHLGATTVDITSMGPAELTVHIIANSGPGYHVVGTAGMSPRGAQYGVVDPDLKVKGFAGLRVIDASVLPIISAAHTQAATYVVAERGADLVKQSWA